MDARAEGHLVQGFGENLLFAADLAAGNDSIDGADMLPMLLIDGRLIEAVPIRPLGLLHL
jgi:hypothetical protein